MEGNTQKTVGISIAILISIGLFFVVSIYSINIELNQLPIYSTNHQTNTNSLNNLYDPQKIFVIERIIPTLLIALFFFLISAGLLLNRGDKKNRYVIWFPLIILLISLCATLTSWYATKKTFAYRANMRFEMETHTTTKNIIDRLTNFANLLQAPKALFLSSDNLTRTDWKNFTEQILLSKNYSSIQGVGYVAFIQPKDLAEHTKKIRAEGFPGYSLHPGGERPLYSAVAYIEPWNEQNQQTLGFDMYQAPALRAPMDRARDTGDVTLSGKITPTAGTATDAPTEFIMFNPIYKNGTINTSTEERQKNITGYVYSQINMNDFMRPIVAETIPNLDFDIFDGATGKAELKIYDIDPKLHNNPAYVTKFYQEKNINIFGHQWLLRFNTLPNYGLNNIEEYLPTVILTIGALFSLLLSGMIYFLISSRQRALALAEKMTAELVNKKDELAKYIDQMSTFSSKLDTNGNFILCSQSLSEASVIPAETLLRYNFINSPWWTFDEAVQTEVAKNFKKVTTTKKPVSFYERAKLKNKIVYLNISLSPVLNEAGDIQFIIAEERDITELKINESQLKKRTYDLERITRNMVGRELKMIELKNKLKQLMKKTTKKE